MLNYCAIKCTQTQQRVEKLLFRYFDIENFLTLLARGRPMFLQTGRALFKPHLRR